MKKIISVLMALGLTMAISAQKKAPKAPAAPAAPVASAAAPAPAADSSGEKPSRAENKFGIGIWLLGADGLAGGYLAYFVVPTIDIEVGGMSLSSSGFSYLILHGGPKWHFLGGNPGQRWSPYLGAEIQYISVSTDLSIVSGTTTTTATGKATGIGIYVPLGIELVAFNGFNFAVEVAYNYVPKITAEATANGVTSKSEFSGVGGAWGGIKLGYRF